MSEQDPHVTISGSDHVVSIGQQGGQTARTIYNLGPPARSLGNLNPLMVKELKGFKGFAVDIQAVHGQNESNNFAHELRTVVGECGWASGDTVNSLISSEAFSGVVFCYPGTEAEMPEAFRVFGEWLLRLGFKASGIYGHEAGPTIVVGPLT